MSSSTLAFDIDAWPETEEKVKQTIEQLSQNMLAQNIDTLVLACTHYPLVKHLFEKALGNECEIIEPSEGVTAQLIRRLTASYPNDMNQLLDAVSKHQGSNQNKGRIELCSSLGFQNMQRLTSWVISSDAIKDRRHVLL
jgi:glutamate racemase